MISLNHGDIDYIEWILEDKLGAPPEIISQRYMVLWMGLFATEFSYCIDRDQNRKKDAEVLRREYLHNENDSGDLRRDMSVLEVLAALAIRVDLEITGDPGDPQPFVIFMDMINNLGLTNARSGFDIMEKLRVWLTREFNYNGVGSPFPLVHPVCDQRLCEIWSQMNAYIQEKY